MDWAKHDGGWADYINWVSGDFDGDGLADIVAIWNDAGRTRSPYDDPCGPPSGPSTGTSAMVAGWIRRRQGT